MKQNTPVTILIFSLLSLLGFNVKAEATSPSAQTPSVTAADVTGLNDIIAKVGDQTISYGELNTLLNSSAIVGLSVPALGTPERNRVRITLLDKAISANLLYLDALKHGVDKAQAYLDDLQRFSDGVVGSLYRQKYLIGDIEVTEADVQAQFERSNMAGQEMTDDLRLGIEAAIRKARFKARAATLRERLRAGVSIVIEGDKLDPDGDAARSDGVVVARIDGAPVYWKEVRGLLQTESSRSTRAAFYLDEEVERTKALDRHIDALIMAKKGRAAGLERDPVYQRRIKEYRKNRLTMLHRENLYRQLEPTEAELWDYYEEHRAQIRVREARKIQMVVLNTRQEAEALKARIEAGELTLYEAARDYSIDPHARQTLGEMGWVSRGTGFPKLDELTFSLGPDQLGGPVESPAGWHLVKVLDQREAQFDDFIDPATRNNTRRRYLHEKMDAYVIELRKHVFPVVVYADNLDRLFKAEAAWIASLERKARLSPQETQQQLRQFKALMQP